MLVGWYGILVRPYSAPGRGVRVVWAAPMGRGDRACSLSDAPATLVRMHLVGELGQQQLAGGRTRGPPVEHTVQLLHAAVAVEAALVIVQITDRPERRAVGGIEATHELR